MGRRLIFKPGGLAWANSYSVNYNGTSGYMLMADNNDLSFVGVPFSLLAWIKVDSLPFVRWTIFSKGTDTLREYHFGVVTNGSGKGLLRFDLNTDGAGANTLAREGAVLAANEMTFGTWYFVVFTSDGSNNVTGQKMYVNAVQNTYTNLSTGTYTGMVNRAGGATIGRFYTDRNLWADGKMSDNAVVNIELSGANITSLYNGGVPLDYRTVISSANIVRYFNIKNTYPNQASLVGSEIAVITGGVAGDVNTDHP